MNGCLSVLLREGKVGWVHECVEGGRERVDGCMSVLKEGGKGWMGA